MPVETASEKSTIADTIPPQAIALDRLQKTFPGGVEAIHQLSLNIPNGQFLAVLGPSGCGKSTLLRMIAGLERPTAGSIHRPQSRVAYVFQDAHLLPWRTVLHNVALPLELRGVSKAQRLTAAGAAIEQVGLTDFAHHYPAELSGGMQMRASLARALVTDPKLLLLDEPFAALDEITRTALDVQLRQLWIQRRMTVIFVTHSIGEAAFLADRAIVLSARPATIVLDVKVDLGIERHNALRGEPEFARVTRLLLSALEDGGGKR